MGKSIDMILSFQAILLAVFHVTFTNGGPLCLGCLHISLPRECNRLIGCGDHEVCYVEQTVSPSGTIWYDSGCMPVTKCKAFSKRSPIRRVQTSHDLSTCLECCHGDYCNAGGCGTTGVYTGTSASLICFNCGNHLDPNTCDLLTGCTDTESCYLSVEPRIITDQVFKSGCISKSICSNLLGMEIVGKRQTGMCNGCCDTDFCNRNCSVLKHPHVEHILPLVTHSETTTQKITHTQTTTTQTANYTSSPTTQQTTHTQSPSTQTGTQTSLPQTQMAILSSSSKAHAQTTVSAKHATLPAPSRVHRCINTGYKYVKALDFCYKIHKDNPTSWMEANLACQLEHAHLIYLKNISYENYLQSVGFYEHDDSHRYWIGASDLREEGTYEWINGLPLGNLQWHAHEPNSFEGNEDCISLMYYDWDKSLLLNDDLCSKRLYYICQEVPRCRPDYTYVKDIDLCYKIHHESNYNWEQARTVCESEGSDLIVVDSLPLMRFLNRTLDNDVTNKNDEKYWIGATDKVKEGQFIWVNGQHVENNLWHPTEPNNANGNENCVALWWDDVERNLGMNDVPCETFTMKFVCQMKW